MERVEAGMFARSRAGHDKGRLYLIWKTQGESVWLIDGDKRPLAKPKKKNLRHIQIIHRIPKCRDLERISDDAVKRAVRQYEKNLIKVEERDVKS